MNSTLTLIYGSQVLPERNFKVPSLGSIESKAEYVVSIPNFQYVKHAMDLTIKIDKSQVNLDFAYNRTDLSIMHNVNLNYVIIQNQATGEGTTSMKKVGYFVVNKRWLSESTIELTLHCDVVNTFIDECVLSDKTRILRQHKDRCTIDGNTNINRIINRTTSPWGYDDTDASYIVEWEWEDGEPTCNNTPLLFDLSMEAPEYTDDDTPIHDDIKITFPSDTCRGHLYLADENFIVRKKLYVQDFGAGSVVRIRSSNGRFVSVQLDSYQVENTHGYKYLVLLCTDIDEDGSNPAMVAVKPWSFDDLTESQQNELIASMEDLNYVSRQGEWQAAVPQEYRYYHPVIDRYSEGIYPELYGKENVRLEEYTEAYNKNWYLIYENQNNPDDSLVNPVSVYLCGSNSTYLSGMGSETTTLTGQDLIDILLRLNNCSSIDEYHERFWHEGESFVQDYGCLFIYNGTEIEFTGGKYDPDLPDVDLLLNTEFACISLYVPPSEISEPLIVVSGLDEYGALTQYGVYLKETSITFTSCKAARFGWPNGVGLEITPSSFPIFVIKDVSLEDVKQLPAVNIFDDDGSTPAEIIGIASIDRTDPKLIKIIELPYCPANVYSGGKHGGISTLAYDGSQWEYNAGKQMLKLKNFSTKFNRYLDLVYHNPTEPLKKKSFTHNDELIISKWQEKRMEEEPKLYHSDFYYEKYFYDSFSFIFQLELITEFKDNFRVIYYVSNTTNSRFMFAFPDYTNNGKQTKDFNTILYISRNNEIALFNQQYVNYIRNGYNYDKKSLELATEQIRESESLSMISGLANFFRSAVDKASVKDYVGMAQLGTSYTTNVYGQVMSNARSIQQKEMGMQAKLRQLKNQSTGVIDANDVDMMEAYARNRLTAKVYECSPKMKKVLFDLFYYTGYVADIQGIPDTTSRIWFNFVQAEVIFKKVPNLPASFINELKQKYAEGITFLHSNTNQDGQSIIDFDQQYENWETKLFE